MEATKIDTEKTLLNVLKKIALIPYSSVDEKKLRQKIAANPDFLLEVVDYIGAEVAYLPEGHSLNKIAKIINNDEGLYEGNLRHYYKFVFYAPSVNNPYHNFRHMIHVLFSVYEAAKFNRYYDLGADRFRSLLIAALMHDYGHSGHMGHDHQEVLNTVVLIEKLILEEDRYILPEIKELVQSTEFPYSDTSVSIGAGILRDADASQSFDDTWLQQIVFGLAQESDISPEACLRQEIDYLQSLHFYSDWGKSNLAIKVRSKITEIEELLELLQ
jgi:hypothetical protein